MDIYRALILTKIFCFFGLALASSELYSVRYLFENSGLLSWNVLSLRKKHYAKGVFNFIMKSPNFKFVLLTRTFLCGVCLICSILNINSLIFELLLLYVVYITMERGRFSLEGSDQMLLVLLGGCICADIIGPESSGFSVIPFCFIAAQALLAYFMAGYAKLISFAWRSGRALPGVMSTEIYGHRHAFAAFSKLPRLSFILCWIIILGELMFPVGVSLGGDVLVFTLFVGALFHISVAVLMGLNVFALAFVGTYPALYFCASQYNFSILSRMFLFLCQHC